MLENVVSDEPEVNKPDGSELKPQELILGRFKTPDELVKAYQELEADYTRKGQALSERDKMLQELQNRIVAPQIQPQNVEDDNELFWQKPMEVINRIVSKTIEPLTTTYYQTQKEKFRSDPEFQNLEPQIDNIVNMYPYLKSQPDIVSQLFKMVKGLYFNEGEYERKVREKVKAEMEGKIGETIEGAGNPSQITREITLEPLTEDEKRFAYNWYSNLDDKITPDEAYKKYAQSKKGYFGG